MEELESCPFCGKNKCVRIRVYPNKDLTRIDKYSVVCDHVHGGCGSESGHYRTAENAVKAWNKRVRSSTNEI